MNTIFLISALTIAAIYGFMFGTVYSCGEAYCHQQSFDDALRSYGGGR